MESVVQPLSFTVLQKDLTPGLGHTTRRESLWKPRMADLLVMGPIGWSYR